MKKAISLALVFVLCLSLCACGNSDPTAKLQKQVTQDINNELDRVYSMVEEVEVTFRNTEVDGDYYNVSGRIAMKFFSISTRRSYTVKTTFEGRYRMDGKDFTRVSLRIDDDWS